MYTLTNLEQLGVPCATHLLEDPAPDSQVTDIVGAILGELEAQIFQLLETKDGRASASQWLAALLDAPPADFLGNRHKAGLEALRSVVLWDAREMHAVTAALGYVEGSASLEERGPAPCTGCPCRYWLTDRPTGMDLLEKAQRGAKTRAGEVELQEKAETLLEELNTELLPSLQPDALTAAFFDRLSDWHSRAVNLTTAKMTRLSPAMQALKGAIGMTIFDKLKDVVDEALKGIVHHAVAEATRAFMLLELAGCHGGGPDQGPRVRSQGSRGALGPPPPLAGTASSWPPSG